MVFDDAMVHVAKRWRLMSLASRIFLRGGECCRSCRRGAGSKPRTNLSHPLLRVQFFEVFKDEEEMEPTSENDDEDVVRKLNVSQKVSNRLSWKTKTSRSFYSMWWRRTWHRFHNITPSQRQDGDRR